MLRNKNFPYDVQIIGISGKIGSGKDAFAEMLANICDIHVERHAFADKVRGVTELVTGKKMSMVHAPGNPFFNAVYNYTQAEKNEFLPIWDKTVGEMLQIIGTDVFRDNLDKNTWIKALFSTEGDGCVKRNHLLVLPDTRFPNEADAILERGGIVVRMEGDPLGVRVNSKRNLNHKSETALDNYEHFTAHVDNSKFGIEILKKEVLNIFENFVK